MTKLRDALNKTLENGQAQAAFCPSDGEGYDTYIKLLNDDEELFESLEMLIQNSLDLGIIYMNIKLTTKTHLTILKVFLNKTLIRGFFFMKYLAT